MKNFTLTLYAFHLRHTLVDSLDEINPQEASLLWENLVKLGKDSLPFDGLKNLRSNLVCYQNDKYDSKLDLTRPNYWLTNNSVLNLGSIPTENLSIKAELQAFLLNDTYAVDLTLLPESPDAPIDISQLQQFKPSSLLPSNIQASLGQTLWIYGEVDENVDCQEVANKYAEALLAETDLKLVPLNQGKLFGSLLFEYQANDPNEPDNCTKRCHILICINNKQAPTVALFEEAYDWLLNLLCCYHKIFYIYQEACQLKPQAKKIYSKLNNEALESFNLVTKSETELNNMKILLKEIAEDALKYSVVLRDLNSHYTSIKTNIINYKTCLEEITNIGNIPLHWQNLLNQTCYQWLDQIETDTKFLIHGKDLFEQVIDSIRGIVEIEQAKQDRSLERTIQVVGVALGGGAIVSGIVAEHIDQPLWIPHLNYPLNPITASLIWTLIATISFGLIANFYWNLKERD